MSKFRKVAFGVLTSFGVSLCLGGLYFFGIAANEMSPDTPTRALSALLLVPGMAIMVAGGFFFLFGSESKEEYGARRARIDENERQSWLAQARNLETAGRYEEAATIYERYNMFADAGRARSSKRAITITGGVGTGQTTVVKEKETIVKEVVLIPCKYCGGLMPQTSESCPNCGASRKRD